MKKIFISFLVATSMLVSLTACGGGKEPVTTDTTTPAEVAEKPAEKPTEEVSTDDTYELALITDVGTIDDKSFNQGSWEGLEAYAIENNITHKYYKPTDKADDAYIASIELAIQGGAKFIVCPGFLFEPAVFAMQTKYPDVKFVLLDGEPKDADYNSSISPNTLGVYYAEEQAGFLAGYAAVVEGYTQLGFMGGMAVPPVVRFGYGFIQGADLAAKDLGIPADTINIKHTYVGNFDATPDNMAKASAWYNDGVEVIFACGGAVGNSVMKAAEKDGKKVIGVDVDQGFESETVITSATKNLQGSVKSALADFYAGVFEGGRTVSLDASEDGVALPMKNSRFETFDQAKYDDLYAKLANGEIVVVRDDVGESALDVPVELVKIESIQ